MLDYICLNTFPQTITRQTVRLSYLTLLILIFHGYAAKSWLRHMIIFYILNFFGSCTRVCTILGMFHMHLIFNSNKKLYILFTLLEILLVHQDIFIALTEEKGIICIHWFHQFKNHMLLWDDNGPISKFKPAHLKIKI